MADDKTNLRKYLWLGYMLIIGCILTGMLGFIVYKEAWIFPPDPPANMNELKDWSELDLWRLMEAYNCGDMYIDNIPDELKELKEFCGAVTDQWGKRYDERKLEKARKGADKLRQ